MARRIAIIDGHPDPAREHLVHALAEAYEAGAREAGHEVRHVALAELEFPLLRSAADYRGGEAPRAIRDCQQTLAWAEHWVILHPLWLGGMPALLKGFLEQVGRPGFAFDDAAGGGQPRRLLGGRSARVVVTMGMPAFFFRWFYGAHGVKSLERSILGFMGVKPVRTTLYGGVEAVGAERRARWLAEVRALGARAA